ncbi:hypothetical protein [Streptomyces sp. NPDC059278]|uniref:hypothetical protein n=1 Tax=Streptomyces sp. NPDC059278 TaxID=3346801 RepID=UPI0036B9DE46
MTTAKSYAPFEYVPDSQEGALRFTWTGGEYINISFTGADSPHAAANTTADDWDGTGPWRSGVAPTQEAFEAACEEWMRHADATELAVPILRSDADED